ncbi:hypothetical protein QTH90_10600 [Variovorax sp. J2P1-59]|jgi:hypothetical protein|uniref:hypothetical protein n=1 Tax=Variovorax flavidus TaxID=3053501 RepID=UPI002577D45A|nr:hypothetical protein [Variovorax sp. J2P1-59]MDM0074831.1 hypothetical protein [Variovorax sp. J2P1-59]
MDLQSDEEIAHAVAVTDHFVVVLRSEELEGWAARFDQIARALEKGDAFEAMNLYAATSYAGPGSLHDVFANDEPAFYAAWGACGRALQDLQRRISRSKRPAA